MNNITIIRECNGFTVTDRFKDKNNVFNEVKDLVSHIKKVATAAEQEDKEKK